MFVDVCGTEYGIPTRSIAEVRRADAVETVNGHEFLRHEGDLYPVIRLEERLGESSETAADEADPPVSASAGGADTAGGDTGEAGKAADGGVGQRDNGLVIRIREETRQVALRCDAVLDQEEVVVKPLEGALSKTPGLGGTAVLGDGHVVAVLDVGSL